MVVEVVGPAATIAAAAATATATATALDAFVRSEAYIVCKVGSACVFFRGPIR